MTNIKRLDYKKLDGNPTLLSLLMAGVRVTFPDGSWLEGRAFSRPMLIGISSDGDGISSARPLNEDGLELAWNDLREEFESPDDNRHENTLEF